MKANGVGVGYSTDSKLPAEFDVTDAVLQAGTNGGAASSDTVTPSKWSWWCCAGVRGRIWKTKTCGISQALPGAAGSWRAQW